MTIPLQLAENLEAREPGHEAGGEEYDHSERHQDGDDAPHDIEGLACPFVEKETHRLMSYTIHYGNFAGKEGSGADLRTTAHAPRALPFGRARDVGGLGHLSQGSGITRTQRTSNGSTC